MTHLEAPFSSIQSTLSKLPSPFSYCLRRCRTFISFFLLHPKHISFLRPNDGHEVFNFGTVKHKLPAYGVVLSYKRKRWGNWEIPLWEQRSSHMKQGEGYFDSFAFFFFFFFFFVKLSVHGGPVIDEVEHSGSVTNLVKCKKRNCHEQYKKGEGSFESVFWMEEKGGSKWVWERCDGGGGNGGGVSSGDGGGGGGEGGVKKKM